MKPSSFAMADGRWAILLISAHRQTDDPMITAAHHHDCSHNLPNLDPLLYELNYKVVGAPDLAERVKELLTRAGFERVRLDGTQDLDHDAWGPLMLMYPRGEIPVCQLSVQIKENAAHHFNVGKALAPLKDEGILIIGSGSATHNLDTLDGIYDSTPTWALDFDSWLVDALTNGRYNDVNEYEKKAPYAKEAHPLPDHIYPLHVAMGAAAAGVDVETELVHHGWYTPTMSSASFKYLSKSSN